MIQFSSLGGAPQAFCCEHCLGEVDVQLMARPHCIARTVNKGEVRVPTREYIVSVFPEFLSELAGGVVALVRPECFVSTFG